MTKRVNSPTEQEKQLSYKLNTPTIAGMISLLMSQDTVRMIIIAPLKPKLH